VGQQHRSEPTDPSDLSDQAAYAPWLTNADPAVVANALICLIHQANYLLDQQIRALEQEFIQGGGYREQLHAARVQARSRQTPRDPSNQSDQSDPHDLPDAPPTACPQCGQGMVLRTAHKGPRAGSRFWGCPAYPNCKGTRPAQPEA
jgi:four helix bundle suffix protein